MKTQLILGLSLVTLLVTPSCTTSEGKDGLAQKATEKIPVKLMPLSRKEVATPVQTSGTFTTNDETYLSFKIPGVIDKIYKQEGDAIHKGELLAALNQTEIEAQVTQAKLGYEKAERDYNRVTNLYKDSVATLEQFQNSKTALEVARKNLETASFNRVYSEIRALSDGFILKKMAHAGQVISTGTPVYQTNGASSHDWKLKVAVSDRDWTRISVGDKSEISIDADGKKLQGHVSRKSESTDPLTGAFTIEITVSDGSKKLASGMFGKATIYPSQQQNVWVLPYESLLDGDGKSAFVFATKDGKTAHMVQVQMESITTDSVLVTTGLDEYQSIVTTGSAYLKEGSSIETIK